MYRQSWKRRKFCPTWCRRTWLHIGDVGAFTSTSCVPDKCGILHSEVWSGRAGCHFQIIVKRGQTCCNIQANVKRHREKQSFTSVKKIYHQWNISEISASLGAFLPPPPPNHAVLKIWHAITYIIQWARSRHKHLLTSDIVSSQVDNCSIQTHLILKVKLQLRLKTIWAMRGFPLRGFLKCWDTHWLSYLLRVFLGDRLSTSSPASSWLREDRVKKILLVVDVVCSPEG